MKKIILLTIVTLTLASCSDNLTNRKAKIALTNCLEEKMDYDFVILDTGKVRIYKDNEFYIKKLNNLKTLSRNGYIIIDSVLSNTSNNSSDYKVELTKKSKEYIIDEVNKYNTQSVKLKSCKYKVQEVIEIFENPSSNSAQLKIVIKPINKTPFYDLMNKKYDLDTIKNAVLIKTNNGWKCID